LESREQSLEVREKRLADDREMLQQKMTSLQEDLDRSRKELVRYL